jgi:hypothetical protein
MKSQLFYMIFRHWKPFYCCCSVQKLADIKSHTVLQVICLRNIGWADKPNYMSIQIEIKHFEENTDAKYSVVCQKPWLKVALGERGTENRVCVGH